MTTLSVYLLYPAAVESGPVVETLKTFGYGFSGSIGLNATGVDHIGDGSPMSDDITDGFDYSARKGWLMVILDRAMASSPHVLDVVPTFGRVVITAADKDVDMTLYRRLSGALFVEPQGSLDETVRAAAGAMLTAEAG